MASRGHDIVAPEDGDGELELHRLATCDVVHVFRRCDDSSRQVVSALARGGVPVTYDNDDDFAALPKDAPTYKKLGGLEGQRGFARSVKMARLAKVFTTTNASLAAKYRAAGVQRVTEIGNYLAPDALRRRVPHDGIVIGWVAGGEHQADANGIKIADALARVVAKHEHVRVECIGVNLALPERYRHEAKVEFPVLQERVGHFDIGIAPLVDIALNRARSDIKLKEYAASGVPWLASPVGPYVGLGEKQGGRLVADDDWFDSIDHLVTHERDRERLARQAHAWAETQTIEAVAHRWERVFAHATGREAVRTASSTRGNRNPRPAIRIRPRRSRRG
jgi:glycosyltransferase involved in cell wall biosynthesis